MAAPQSQRPLRNKVPHCNKDFSDWVHSLPSEDRRKRLEQIVSCRELKRKSAKTAALSQLRRPSYVCLKRINFEQALEDHFKARSSAAPLANAACRKEPPVPRPKPCPLSRKRSALFREGRPKAKRPRTKASDGALVTEASVKVKPSKVISAEPVASDESSDADRLSVQSPTTSKVTDPPRPLEVTHQTGTVPMTESPDATGVIRHTEVTSRIQPSGATQIIKLTEVVPVTEASGQVIKQTDVVPITEAPGGIIAQTEVASIIRPSSATGVIRHTEEAAKTPPSGATEVVQNTSVALAAQPSGATEIVQNTSVALAAQPSGATEIAQNTSVALAAQPSGATEIAQNTSVALAAQPSGATEIVQNTSVALAAQPSGAREVVQNTSGALAAQPSGATEVVQNTSVAIAAQPSGATEVVQNTLAALAPLPSGAVEMRQPTAQQLNDKTKNVASARPKAKIQKKTSGGPTSQITAPPRPSAVLPLTAPDVCEALRVMALCIYDSEKEFVRLNEKLILFDKLPHVSTTSQIIQVLRDSCAFLSWKATSIKSYVNRGIVETLGRKFYSRLLAEVQKIGQFRLYSTMRLMVMFNILLQISEPNADPTQVLVAFLAQSFCQSETHRVSPAEHEVVSSRPTSQTARGASPQVSASSLCKVPAPQQQETRNRVVIPRQISAPLAPQAPRPNSFTTSGLPTNQSSQPQVRPAQLENRTHQTQCVGPPQQRNPHSLLANLLHSSPDPTNNSFHDATLSSTAPQAAKSRPTKQSTQQRNSTVQPRAVHNHAAQSTLGVNSAAQSTVGVNYAGQASLGVSSAAQSTVGVNYAGQASLGVSSAAQSTLGVNSAAQTTYYSHYQPTQRQYSEVQPTARLNSTGVPFSLQMPTNIAASTPAPQPLTYYPSNASQKIRTNQNQFLVQSPAVVYPQPSSSANVATGSQQHMPVSQQYYQQDASSMVQPQSLNTMIQAQTMNAANYPVILVQQAATQSQQYVMTAYQNYQVPLHGTVSAPQHQSLQTEMSAASSFGAKTTINELQKTAASSRQAQNIPEVASFPVGYQQTDYTSFVLTRQDYGRSIQVVSQGSPVARASSRDSGISTPEPALRDLLFDDQYRSSWQ